MAFQHRPGVLAALAVAMSAALGAQTQIDGVLLKLGSDVITQSDVRQARLLKLVHPSGSDDQAYVDAIANRRLMLAEVRLAAPSDVSADAVNKKYADWTAALGPGADVPRLLAQAATNDAGLRAWLRDDLRLQAYIDQRFPAPATREHDVAAWLTELRRRVGLK